MIHVAGLPITVGSRVRQRCAWCGETIDDTDLSRVGVPIEDAGRPWPTWEVGALVVVDGNARWMYQPAETTGTTPIPEDSCLAIDPDVTV